MREACRFCGCVTMHASNCPYAATLELKPISAEYRQVVKRYKGHVVDVRYEFVPGSMRYEDARSSVVEGK